MFQDSLVCTWSLSGNLLNKTYYKAPIWSIDVSEDNLMIYVGGGDGSVYMQPFEHYKSLETIFLPGNSTCNFPKYVSYLHDGSILVFSELGTLQHYNKEMVPKNTIYLAKDRYYIMQVSLDRRFVALASRDGYVIIYKGKNVYYNKNPYIYMYIQHDKIFVIYYLINMLYIIL